MDKRQKRELKRKKKRRHLDMLSQHEAIRQKAEDAFNLANYKIHLHSNPDHHAQMAEESSKPS
jgi:hypothetical protein